MNWIDSPVAGLENSPELERSRRLWGVMRCRSFRWHGSEEPFRLRYQSTVAVIAVASGVPALPNVDSYLVVSSTNGLVELVGHLDQLPHHRVEQAESAHGQLGQRANADRVPDIAGDEVEELAGRDRLGSRQVPDLTDRAFVGPERGQAGGDVRDIAVGVGQIGVADEVGAFVGERVGEHPLAERRLGGDPGAEEVRRPPDRDPDATGLRMRPATPGSSPPGFGP